MKPETMPGGETTPDEIFDKNNEKIASLVKWNLTVNNKQTPKGDVKERLTAQVAGVATEVLGVNLPLESGRTVYSNLKDGVAIEVVPMSEFFETDGAGRTTKARVLKQAFNESFKGWGKNIMVREEKGGKETESIITIRLGIHETQAITDWMVYTPNWRQNISETTNPKIPYDKWKNLENERRDKINLDLIAEGKPPYKKIIKSSYTMRDWFDEENDRRKTMGEEPLQEPQSGILQEGTTMPDALTILKDSKEIVGFTEVKGYTFEELKGLVIAMRTEREQQIIHQQENRAWENNLDGPITPTVAPQAKINVGNGEFIAGVNLLGEEKMINNLRGLLYGGNVEKANLVSTILPSKSTSLESNVEVKGGKSTDLAERTVAVLRFLEAPEGKAQEYDELLQELGKYITEYGYQNVIIQTLTLNHEQVVDKGFESLRNTLTTEDEQLRKTAYQFSDTEIINICDVVGLEPDKVIAHVKKPFSKKA